MSETSKRKRGCFLISTLRRPDGLGRRAAVFLWAFDCGRSRSPRPGRRLGKIKGCKCSDDRSMAGPFAAAALCVGLTAGLGISHAAADPTPKDVLKIYADIAQAGYTDSVDTARTLKLAVDAFLAKPTEDNLRAARAAWIAARIPYMQTEAYRFGNAIVDDWEGKVNSWPLDEGLIDYVAAAYGTEFARERSLCRQRDRPHLAHHRRQEARHLEDHQGASGRQAARGRRRRGQCRDRLPRRRVPAVGPGSERHRARQRQSPGDRLRHQEVHQRQLRAARAISPRRHRSPRRRPRLDGGAMGARTARRARRSRMAATRPVSPRS